MPGQPGGWPLRQPMELGGSSDERRGGTALQGLGDAPQADLELLDALCRSEAQAYRLHRRPDRPRTTYRGWWRRCAGAGSSRNPPSARRAATRARRDSSWWRSASGSTPAACAPAARALPRSAGGARRSDRRSPTRSSAIRGRRPAEAPPRCSCARSRRSDATAPASCRSGSRCAGQARWPWRRSTRRR